MIPAEPTVRSIAVAHVADESSETAAAVPALERRGAVSAVRTSPGTLAETLSGRSVDCLLVDGRDWTRATRQTVQRVAPETPVVLVLDDEERGVDAAVPEYIRRRDAADPDCLQTRLESIAAGTGDRNRERVLRALHEVATELPECDSVEAVCERTLEAAETVLEFDNCVVLLAAGDRLELVALSDDFPARDFDSLPIDDSLGGYTYRTGESAVIDNASSHPEATPQGPYESGISLPIGEHGVCQMISESKGAFGEDDRELAELLVSHTEAALDRLTREAELTEQNERLEQFASVVSHDLRSPLQVAQGRVGLAQATYDSEELEIALDALERMNTMIDDLLTLARGGADLGEIQTVSLSALVEECWRTVETGEATLETDGDARLRADQSRLRQLLENLVRNAVEHAGAPVTVTVGALADGQGFYVADDGPGISEEDREKVFTPGYSSDGTGFGLAIVERIVDAHGWTIDVTDSDAGGTRFVVTGIETVPPE